MHDFLCELTGEVVFPDSPDYPEKRQGYNRAVQQCPCIIVYCRDRQDVINAICWARTHCTAIRIRSGGHNYEGYSNGNCTLAIDISKMNQMRLEEETGLLRVQAGVTNQQVYRYVSSKGYPFPGGTCPTVGVSGYTLGGGWGLSCRRFGLGCDNVIDIELVDYNGCIIRTNSNQNSDLFWALRGAGGGNLGVVTEMTFQLPEKVNMVTLIEIEYLHISREEQEAFVSIWQTWLHAADDRITMISRLYHSLQDDLAILARGIFYGTPQEAQEAVNEFLLLPNVEYTIEAMSFLEAVEILGASYPAYEKFNAVSGFVVQDFTADEIRNIAGLLQDPAEGAVFTGFSMYALGGRVAQVSADATAFAHRNAHFIVWLETVWEDEKYANGNRAWICTQLPFFQSITSGSYVNFPYSCLPCYLNQYYKHHLYMLTRVKEKYDPWNVFSFPQGIIASAFDASDCQYPLGESGAADIGAETRNSAQINYRGFRYISPRP